MSYAHYVDTGKYGGWFNQLPINRVQTVDDIKCFGATFEAGMHESMEDKLPEFEAKFMEALNNTIETMVWDHFVGHSPSLITRQVDTLHSFPEGGLPEEGFDVVTVPYYSGLNIAEGDVIINLLATPMYMDLAQINSRRRVLFLAYFNLQFKGS